MVSVWNCPTIGMALSVGAEGAKSLSLLVISWRICCEMAASAAVAVSYLSGALRVRPAVVSPLPEFG